MTALVLSRHASLRAAEFGLGLDVVTEIASRPSVTHTNKLGETVCVADSHPEWTVVLGSDGDVVVTILRRTRDRWEHDPAAARRRPVAAAPSIASQAVTPPVQPVEVARRAVDVTRRQAAVRRRPASIRARDVVVSVQVDPDALRLARELADGDLRRLSINRDGTVTVLNKPRSAR